MSLSEMDAKILKLQAQLNATNEILDSFIHGTEVDQFFLLIMGMVIFLMQCGFALLEAGSVRSKNTTNILIKNLLDAFISGLSYWLFGYAFGFGEGNKFIGYNGFALSGVEGDQFAFWFFQYVFAATATTIVSGAVAERCDFVAYLVYSFCITGFIYPVITHWAWSSGGWLAVGFTDGELEISYSDFAGSGVVHCAGGVCAFVGAAVIGPRKGRFDKESGKPQDIKGHSVPLAALGGFILLFGFLAFNGSSQGAISSPGDGTVVATAVKNTVLGGTGGAFITLTLNRIKWFGNSTWSFLTTLNGCLAGMVAVCANCNQTTTYGAFVIGIGGGIFYMIFTWGVLKLKVDDPLDATAVHLGGGLWGVIATALLSTDFGIFYKGDRQSALHLVWQLAGVGTIIAWSVVLSFIMFFILKKTNILRVSFDLEVKGLDIPKHGEPAYPVGAYGHGWGEQGDTVGHSIEQLTKKENPVLSMRASDYLEVDSLKKLSASSYSINVSANGSTNQMERVVSQETVMTTL